jgi:hypothetical protein
LGASVSTRWTTLPSAAATSRHDEDVTPFSTNGAQNPLENSAADSVMARTAAC